jgi:hypothetical protein
MLLFIPLWIIIVYLHFLVVFGAYSLLIGRGSVLNTGPLFLISLFPSVANPNRRCLAGKEPDIRSKWNGSRGKYPKTGD